MFTFVQATTVQHAGSVESRPGRRVTIPLSHITRFTEAPSEGPEELGFTELTLINPGAETPTCLRVREPTETILRSTFHVSVGAPGLRNKALVPEAEAEAGELGNILTILGSALDTLQSLCNFGRDPRTDEALERAKRACDRLDEMRSRFAAAARAGGDRG